MATTTITFAKRHYEALAQTMQDTRCHLRCDALNQQQCVQNTLADMLAKDSPRFDRARFLRACEPGANVRAYKVA